MDASDMRRSPIRSGGLKRAKPENPGIRSRIPATARRAGLAQRTALRLIGRSLSDAGEVYLAWRRRPQGKALEQAVFEVGMWRDDTPIVLDWFKSAIGAPPPGGLNLLVMGADFPAKASNLARNIRENRLGVLSAVLPS